jgi:ribosomal protein S18 acetylase RimI-like enzyme
MKIGEKLINHFLNQVSSAGLQGIHLATLESNKSGCAFFERNGFKEISRYPIMHIHKKKMIQTNAVVYGIKLHEIH